MDVVCRAHVAASLGYLSPTRERPFNYMFQPPAGKPWHNCEYEQRLCRIHDARPLASAMSLDVTGFRLLDVPAEISDFRDEGQVTGAYYRQMEALAKSLWAARRRSFSIICCVSASRIVRH